MTIEHTLGLIKPDAVEKNLIGRILAVIEAGGLRIVGTKMVHLSADQAKAFYRVHAHRPFFAELVEFISSGPILAIVIEGENAITSYRNLMGSTNPKEAAAGTIRAQFANSIDKNAVHGSDSAQNARDEIAFFFKRQEIFSR